MCGRFWKARFTSLVCRRRYYEVPAARYQPSPRRFDGRLRSPDYPHDAEIRRVRRTGEIKWRNRSLFLTEVLSGEPVGLFLIGPETGW